MQEQFVTYEIALKLKELGFEEECFGYWYGEEDLIYCDSSSNGIYPYKTQRDDDSATAPLWQQVIDWFRETYNYNITYNVLNGFNGEIVKIYIFKGGDIQSKFKILSKRTNFYKAREQAILKVIELCKNN